MTAVRFRVVPCPASGCVAGIVCLSDEVELGVAAHQEPVAHQRWRAAGGMEAEVHGPIPASVAALDAFRLGLAISDAIAAEQRRATRR